MLIRILVTLLLLLPACAHTAMPTTAKTYYVAMTGSDSTSCSNASSQSTPKRTIGAGLTCLSAGDTLLIQGGTYNELFPSGTRWPSGTASQPITIAAAPGERVVIQPATRGDLINVLNIANAGYLVFDGLSIDGAHCNATTACQLVKLDQGSHDVTIKNSVIANGRNGNGVLAQGPGHQFLTVEVTGNVYGLYITGQNNTLDTLYVHDNAGYGVHIYNSGHSDVSGNVVRHSRIVHNGYAYTGGGGSGASCAMLLSSGAGNRACGNEIRDHNGCGVQVYGYATHKAEVLKNRITGNKGACIDIQAGSEGNAPARETLVRGNVCEGNAGDIVDRGQGSRVEGNGPAAAVSTAAVQDDCGGTPLSSLPLSLPAPYQLRAVRLP